MANAHANSDADGNCHQHANSDATPNAHVDQSSNPYNDAVADLYTNGNAATNRPNFANHTDTL